MRIAILSNVLPTADATGGAGRIAYIYAELLRGLGHEVKAFGPRAAFAELGQMDALTRLAFHAQDLVGDDVKIAEILEWEPKILLTHNLTGCGFKTPRQISDVGVRWVHVLHDVQLFEPSGQILSGESFGWARWLWRVAWSLLRQSSMRNPDVVVSPTQWLLDMHKKFWMFDRGVRTMVIPNPILPNVDSSDGHRRNNQKTGQRILFVGRVDIDKGICVLLDAWKNVDAQAQLTIVGDGNLREQIASQKIDRVTCVGSKSPDDVARLMSQSDVVVVPSLVMENQPTVILEALAAGCRVVASDVGGIRETLGDAGWIVPPADPKKLAAAINEALQPTTYSLQPAQEILAQHDPQRCIQKISDALFS
jgi:glycosyltransferase involved in cell wall biosynthesis